MMGRVKSTMIKKAAFQIHGGFEGFNEDFYGNKKFLKGTMPSKSVRNKVAGQIVRLSKQERIRKTLKQKVSDDEQNDSE